MNSGDCKIRQLYLVEKNVLRFSCSSPGISSDSSFSKSITAVGYLHGSFDRNSMVAVVESMDGDLNITTGEPGSTADCRHRVDLAPLNWFVLLS
jgi:hypothetical protein